MYGFDIEGGRVSIELYSERMVGIKYDLGICDSPYPENYMVKIERRDDVPHIAIDDFDSFNISTEYMKIRINRSPFRISFFDTSGRLLSRDAGDVYKNGNTVGIKREEGVLGAGGIFGFGAGDHGRRDKLNFYDEDYRDFTMSHGRVIVPFFMSSVGYGIFLNTMSENTVFFKRGGGFETAGKLEYFFIAGPSFKDILNEYSDVFGRMELYGKWAHGFMLSKYGNDNATQKEFSEWINRLRNEGYPSDCYVFDYGWRGDVNVEKPNFGAGEKWGNQMWSNDRSKFPDIGAMFEEARRLGFRVGLHNNAGTPEASGGDKLYIKENAERWADSYMESVIKTGYGDWFWPDEFDVLGSNSAPVLSAKRAYERWKEYTEESRPMFITRGSYAGQHYATCWSGDIDASERDLKYQIGFAIDTGLVGYYATSCDLGGFKSRPTDELYTRFTAEFGAWSAIMRTHGHDGREPWDYSEIARKTLKKNLKIRYSLYPYIYSTAWQGYRFGTPMMRAMILEDGSQSNPDAWNLRGQYYFGDFILVAPATRAKDTAVAVWFPPKTKWFNYYTGECYEGGDNGKIVNVPALIDEIPVFIKAGAIIPKGPDVNYADEKPLTKLTLDIYPHGSSEYTLYEDDGVSRKYITDGAYATTHYSCSESNGEVVFKIDKRYLGNPDKYTPVSRYCELVFHNVVDVRDVEFGDRPIIETDAEMVVSDLECTLKVTFCDSAEDMKLAFRAQKAQVAEGKIAERVEEAEKEAAVISLNGRENVLPKRAKHQDGIAITSNGAAALKKGASLGWESIITESKKKSITLRVRTGERGGTVTVYETGIGDKILAVITPEADGEWHTMTVPSKDTDLDPSAIYFVFTEEGMEIEYWRFA